MSPSLKGSDARPAIDQVSTAPIDRLSRNDQILNGRYGVWIQTLVNHPIGTEKGVYLSTFQEGRGQHITALDTEQARALGNRLIALAEEIETKAGGTPTQRWLEEPTRALSIRVLGVHDRPDRDSGSQGLRASRVAAGGTDRGPHVRDVSQAVPQLIRASSW
jgi:hypothetical protein